MPCVTQSLTRQLQLALPLSKRKGPYSQAITGGLPIFSSVTGVGPCGGKDAALDVTITHPLKSDTRAGAALTPGHAASVTFENKMRGAAELCRAEGLAFVPIVAESLGGFHPVAIEQLKRIASALARHTAQEESEAIHHLLSRCSLLLQRGTASPLIIHFSHLPLY